MAQSKFEQYLEILNNKRPHRAVSNSTPSASEITAAAKAPEQALQDELGSPLRTKQYLKSTLAGDSPGHQTSHFREHEVEQASAKNQVLDFSQAELPFSNFQSLQEKDRMYMREAATTVSAQEDVRSGPSISEYYSLARRQNIKQEAQFQSVQQQVESMQSSITLLLDKYEAIEYRLGFCESNLTQKLDHNALREKNDNSRLSAQEDHSTSQLRNQQRLMGIKTASQVRLMEDNSQLVDRINNLQIQIDRLDQRTNELRDEQMRQAEDPRPLITEQIDNLMQHIDRNFAKKSALTASIDNLGEEIAGDINSFENNLRIESQRIEGMADLVTNMNNDLKICQISIAKMPLPIDGNTDTQNFSETLVKQLLRQGEDRKTSVEDTKVLQSKIQEVKLTQKRHHEKQLKQSKRLAAYEEELRHNSNTIEKLRVGQHKISTIQTNFKFNKAELVSKDEIARLKERINSAFETLIRLHESTMDRDAIICESLLETQLGKLRRLIVKRHTHDSLKMFADALNEPFEKPEILLSMKPEAAWRQHTSGESTLKGAIRRSQDSGRHRKSTSSRRKRTKSRETTHGSQPRGGTQTLSSRGVMKVGISDNAEPSVHSQPQDGKRRTVYRQYQEQARRKYDAYQDQSENDYYREQSSVFDDEMQDITDGEGEETVSYMEELPILPKRKRSNSRKSRQHNGKRNNNYPPRVPDRHQQSRSSRRSQSQRSEGSKKSGRSQRARKDYTRADRHLQHYRQGSRDGRTRKGKCSKRQQSDLPKSDRSSNKDLQMNSRNEQKFPMFGYQVCSTATAGIGDIYENTKGGATTGMVPDKSNGGSTYTSLKKRKSQQAQKSGPQLAVQHTMQQSEASANFAKEDDSIHEQQDEGVLKQLSDASKMTLNQKNSFNYENQIHMWGGGGSGSGHQAPSATK